MCDEKYDFNEESEDEQEIYFDYQEHTNRLQQFIADELDVSLDFARFFLHLVLKELNQEEYTEIMYTVKLLYNEIADSIEKGEIITGINENGEVFYQNNVEKNDDG